MKRNEKLIMFRKPMSIVAVRRFATVLTTLALSLSGLVFSPAQANVPVNGSYSCATGVKDGDAPRYTITTGVVSSGSACAGDLIIPEGVTSIGDAALRTSTIKSVTIPASVTSINQYAFDDTKQLTKITFATGSKLTTIGQFAFQGSVFQSIAIPASVTSIGKEAFRDTRPLINVLFASNSAPSVGSTPFLFIGGSPRALIKPGATGFGSPGSLWNGLLVVESQILPVDNGSYSCATGVIDGPGNKYTISNSAVSAGTSCTGSVVLPTGVTDIGSNAFLNSSITSITISEGVRSIGSNAFNGATSLTEARFLGITAPTVGANAFSNVSIGAAAVIQASATGFGAIGSSWNGLQVLDAEALLLLPANGSYSCQTGVINGPGNKYQVTNGVLSGGAACIGAVVIADGIRGTVLNAFQNASALTSITFPASLTTIGAGAFSDTNSLTSFTVAPANPNFTSIDGVLFDKAATSLLVYPVGKSNTAYSIPAGVTSVADRAFRKSRLTSVTMPEGVSSIGREAFSEALALTSITLPEGVTSIGANAFSQTALSSITLPSTVTSIGNGTFQYVRTLKSINIPAGVTSIGEDTFMGTNKLETVTFAPGSQLTSIGVRAFQSSSIRVIAIPSGVITIGERAFQDAMALDEITFAPESQLTTIGTYAFYEAKQLTSIAIPASVTSIGFEAFRNSSKLTDFLFKGNAPASVGANAFTGIASSAKASIKTGAIGFGAPGGTWNGLTVSVGFYEAVSFNTKGGSIVGTRDYAANISAPTAPTKPGYMLAGWTATDGDLTTITFPYAPSEFVGITLYAKWTPNTYAVNWNPKGGTAVSHGSFITGGDVATAPTAPTRAGYTFVGWTASNGGSTIVTFPHTPGVIENISLYAKWTLNSYTVTWDSKGGTAVPAGSFVIDGEIALPLGEPTLVDHLFLGWSATDGGSVVSFPHAPGVLESITLYAKWINVPLYEPELNTYPSISGNAIQNTFLVATTGTWSALPEAVKTLQWYRCEKPVIAGVAEFTDAQDCKSIPGATKPNYKVGVADQSKYLTVLTEAKNIMGSTDSTAKSVLVPKAALPVLKSAPKISGSVVKGSTLTLSVGTWYANPVATTTQQWYRCEKPVSAGISELIESVNCVKIPGATKAEYKTVTADQANYLTALVSSKNSQGVVTESAKSIRVLGTKPTAKTSPKISGAKVAGGLLQATNGTWSAVPEATTSVAWYRCATAVTAGAAAITSSMGCKKISGATSSTYSVAVADQGKHLTVLVNAKNTDGKASSTAASIFIKVPEVKPTAKSSPKISGAASVGVELRATNGTWSAVPEATTSVAWYRCATAVTAGAAAITSSMGCKKISGATSSTYLVAVADQGKYLTVLVTAKNSKGNASSTAKSVFIKVPVTTP